jgi:hypothetical protein
MNWNRYISRVNHCEPIHRETGWNSLEWCFCPPEAVLFVLCIGECITEWLKNDKLSCWTVLSKLCRPEFHDATIWLSLFSRRLNFHRAASVRSGVCCGGSVCRIAAIVCGCNAFSFSILSWTCKVANCSFFQVDDLSGNVASSGARGKLDTRVQSLTRRTQTGYPENLARFPGDWAWNTDVLSVTNPQMQLTSFHGWLTVAVTNSWNCLMTFPFTLANPEKTDFCHNYWISAAQNMRQTDNNSVTCR